MILICEFEFIRKITELLEFKITELKLILNSKNIFSYPLKRFTVEITTRVKILLHSSTNSLNRSKINKSENLSEMSLPFGVKLNSKKCREYKRLWNEYFKLHIRLVYHGTFGSI